MAGNWNRPLREKADEEEHLIAIRFSLTSALAGVVSMTFALIGGLICKGKIWW